MIVRQAWARYGGIALRAASKHALRHYATETSLSEASKTLASIDKQVGELRENTKALQTEIYAKISEHLSAFDVPEQIAASSSPPVTGSTDQDPENDQFTTKRAFDQRQHQLYELAGMGSSLRVTYDPRTAFKRPPTASELTLPMLMAAQTHLGHATSLWNPRNSSYIFGIRDGIHIISLDVTFAYLVRAAKVVAEVARRGGLILFVGTRDKQEEIVVKVAKMAGGYHIFDRWVPGTLSNGQQILGHCRLKVVDVLDEELPRYSALLDGPSDHPVMKPDLVVCLNPLENEVCLHECGRHNVPTIGVIDTDADASRVTYPIPANDDSLRSITLIAGVLGHAGAQGQKRRMEAANAGTATYGTNRVVKALAELEEVNNTRAMEKSGASTE